MYGVLNYKIESMILCNKIFYFKAYLLIICLKHFQYSQSHYILTQSGGKKADRIISKIHVKNKHYLSNRLNLNLFSAWLQMFLLALSWCWGYAHHANHLWGIESNHLLYFQTVGMSPTFTASWCLLQVLTSRWWNYRVLILLILSKLRCERGSC